MKLPISVLILAKNEEKTIRFCIEPLRRRVREILVGDTGSSDRTRAIARSLGARIVPLKIKNDFSKARNALLDKANQPWVLMLDADRRIAPGDVPKLADLLKKGGADAYEFSLRNYTNSPPMLCDWRKCKKKYPFEEKFSGAYGYYPSRHILFFKNTPLIRFCFPVHESLLPDIGKNRFKIKPAGIPVHHFEFKKGLRHHLKKHLWYLRLERKTVRQWPQYSKNYFNLAYDLVLSGKGSGEVLKIASLLTKRWPSSLAWALKALAYMLRGNLRSADRCASQAMRLEKNSVNLCLYGWIQLKKNRFKQAEKFLRQALEKRGGHPLALNLLGVVKERTGFQKEAIAWFERAIEILPVYPDAIFNRALVCNRLKKSEK